MINLEKFKHKSWLDGRIIAINADCFDVMREIKDKEIDLVLTDPPYGGGCNAGVGGFFKKYEKQINRTGGTWSKKYQETNNIKHWDIAPENQVFEEIFIIFVFIIGKCCVMTIA